jgi:hypothetical protein
LFTLRTQLAVGKMWGQSLGELDVGARTGNEYIAKKNLFFSVGWPLEEEGRSTTSRDTTGDHVDVSDVPHGDSTYIMTEDYTTMFKKVR